MAQELEPAVESCLHSANGNPEALGYLPRRQFLHVAEEDHFAIWIFQLGDRVLQNGEGLTLFQQLVRLAIDGDLPWCV